jgi:glucokinase
MTVIGIDLGGTNIKAGRFAKDGTCLAFANVKTPNPPLPEATIEQLEALVSQLDPAAETLSMGVGLPGPTDAAGRIALHAINLPGWEDVSLAEALERKLGKPTVLANDANCAGVGEGWLGAARGYRSAIVLTLGTGVGGAILLDGKLFTGHAGAAGELGLIALRPEGPLCNSGNQGSLEQYVSATAIRRRTGKSPRELDRLARAGDELALAEWHRVGCDLGIGLASLIYVLTPQVVAIGGGVSQSADLFLPSAIAEVERRVLPTSRIGLQIVPAQLGNRAGCIGAAKLAWDCLVRAEQIATA